MLFGNSWQLGFLYVKLFSEIRIKGIARESDTYHLSIAMTRSSGEITHTSTSRN